VSSRRTTQRSQSTRRKQIFSAISAISAFIVVACGQKGPPLPPLVLTPAPPVVTADRRGSTIEIGFTAPSANVDGSRPANIVRIDIFAINGVATTITDLEMIKRGTRVASVPVKSPRNPNDTVEAGESAEVLEPPEGKGLDQGAASNVAEQITASMLQPNDTEGTGSQDRVPPEAVPLLGPSEASSIRTYIGVGVDRRGRLGSFSKRVTVPLALAPPQPLQPSITYTETTITLRWSSPSSDVPHTTAGLLPSKPFGYLRASRTYNVYDSATGVRLTSAPVKAPEYEDSRIEWGATRCYAVRAVEVIGGSALESEASEPRCEKLVDTFPPAAPKGLSAVSIDGAINLIWEANAEADLAGYYVLRAQLPDTRLIRVTSTPIQDASFLDNVQPGARFVYAVTAVDKAGNISEPSNRVEETAR
jgi:hypothetical protein